MAQAEAELFLSYGLTNPKKTTIIPYGIDITRFASSPINNSDLREALGVEQGFIILTVCRLNVPRDFVSLLTAFEKVLIKFPNTHLLIVGDGPQNGAGRLP